MHDKPLLILNFSKWDTFSGTTYFDIAIGELASHHLVLTFTCACSAAASQKLPFQPLTNLYSAAVLFPGLFRLCSVVQHLLLVIQGSTSQKMLSKGK